MFNWHKPADTKPKTLGLLGEEAAREEYKKLGYQIIAANEYNKKGKQLGEIDFIAVNKDKIIFVEVKTRNIASNKFGTGAEAVNIYKQRKILAAVKMYFLRNRKYFELQPQIDVCLMDYSEVDKSFKCAKIIANAVEDWS
ncbi:MAG: YraN family protein [Candidatus Doudnabacteria bacterium]|nr:YraN family protein [Candidatus Doudnabacteria bacterium]